MAVTPNLKFEKPREKCDAKLLYQKHLSDGVKNIHLTIFLLHHNSDKSSSIWEDRQHAADLHDSPPPSYMLNISLLILL